MNAHPSSSADAAAADKPLVELTLDAYGVPGVARLTLNRPDAFNALSEALIDALQEQLSALASSAARVVVIAGAGRAFCAGHDLREMRAAPSRDYYTQLFARCSKLMLTIQKMPQPVIARVHGAAFAGGWALAIVLPPDTFGLGISEDTWAHILQAILFACGVFVMVAFVRGAQRVEPFIRRA